MIAGVRVEPLKQIPDERGKILHMMRCDTPGFEKFGEIYFSAVYPGVIKGWHIHKEMTLNYAVPIGHVKMVLYDERPDSVDDGQGAGNLPGRIELLPRDRAGDGAGTASRESATRWPWSPTARRSRIIPTRSRAAIRWTITFRMTGR